MTGRERSSDCKRLFGHLDFEFVSRFEIRISDFKNVEIATASQLRPDLFDKAHERSGILFDREKFLRPFASILTEATRQRKIDNHFSQSLGERGGSRWRNERSGFILNN